MLSREIAGQNLVRELGRHCFGFETNCKAGIDELVEICLTEKKDWTTG
jgi:hypothetical protein